MLLLISICFSCNERKDSEQLKNEVIEKEVLFIQLVNDFESSLPDSNYVVTFGIGSSIENVNLTYYKNNGNVSDKKNHFGGQNLQLHSPELDNVMENLGWTYQTIEKLATDLNAIQYDYIRNTDWFGKPINIYDSPDGFAHSAYNIYPSEMLETVKVIHGEPIGQTDFLKRVYVMTSSSL